MKSEWKVSVQWLCDKYMYCVFRLLDITQIWHSGNMQIYKPLGYINDKDKCQRVADALNAGARAELDEAIANGKLDEYLAQRATKEVAHNEMDD